MLFFSSEKDSRLASRAIILFRPRHCSSVLPVYVYYYKSILEACRACVGRVQRKSTVHELCTAHSARRRKKKRGHTNPDVRTIIYEKSQMYHPCGARFARPTRNMQGMCGASAAKEHCA